MHSPTPPENSQMDLQTEIEAIRILDLVLSLPPTAREYWLDSQGIETRIARRVRDLLKTASETGEFLEVPAVFESVPELPRRESGR